MNILRRAAYTNILRDLNITCITSNRVVWRHGSWTNQKRYDGYGFWSKPSVKVEIKTTSDWLVLVKYCDLLDWIRAKWLRIDKKIVPVSQRLRISPWGFVSKGGRRPQRSISTTVNGECSTSHLRNVWRMGLDGKYRKGDRHRDTSLTVEVVWRQKFTKLWALNYLLSLAC